MLQGNEENLTSDRKKQMLITPYVIRKLMKDCVSDDYKCIYDGLEWCQCFCYVNNKQPGMLYAFFTADCPVYHH
jgi:hypothetical protein